MSGNYPDNISPSDPNAPWNQSEGISEELEEKIELLDKARTYAGWLREALGTYELLDKDEFYLAFRHTTEVGDRTFDRMRALDILKVDIEYALLDLMPEEKEEPCDPES